MAPTRGFKTVITTDLVFQVLFWGVPGFIANTRLAGLWEVELPENLVYARLLGTFSVGWAYLLFRALRNAGGNADIIRGAVVSHTLIAITVLYSLFSKGVTGYLSVPFWSTIFWWVTIFLNVGFAVGILLTAPRAEALSGRNKDLSERERLEEEIRLLRDRVRELQTNVHRREPAGGLSRSDRPSSGSRGEQRRGNKDEPAEERRGDFIAIWVVDESARLIGAATRAYIDSTRAVMNEWYSFAAKVLRPLGRRRR